MTNPANPMKGKTFTSGREHKGRQDKTPEPEPKASKPLTTRGGKR